MVALKLAHVDFTGCHKTAITSGLDKIIYIPLDYIDVLKSLGQCFLNFFESWTPLDMETKDCGQAENDDTH